MKHKSVMLMETINNLNVKPDGIYIDCTLGYAGHSSEVLKRLNEKGFLFAFDQDIDAINYSDQKLSKISKNYKIFKSNFVDIKKYIDKDVDGIMFDLGVSSPQLDTDERGFSFHKNAYLDMRMDRDNTLDAHYVVNNYSERELSNIFYKYGDEKYSKQIAKNIVNNRPIDTTLELVEVIKNSVPESYRVKHHPARKVFQAIRIEVNHEIDILNKAINDAFDLLKVGGRLAVITFHSLEDKTVAGIFKELCSDDKMASKLPMVPENMKARAKQIIKIIPNDEEIDENNRSRSAKLRVIERVR
mgnify:CR=1 FL=1